MNKNCSTRVFDSERLLKSMGDKDEAILDKILEEIEFIVDAIGDLWRKDGSPFARLSSYRERHSRRYHSPR